MTQYAEYTNKSIWSLVSSSAYKELGSHHSLLTTSKTDGKIHKSSYIPKKETNCCSNIGKTDGEYRESQHKAETHVETIIGVSAKVRTSELPLTNCWQQMCGRASRWRLRQSRICQTCSGKAWVWSLGWEDILEKRMASSSSILAWRIPWTEEPDVLQSMGLQKESGTI